jgi:endo-1,4-beta-xylanase
MDTPVDVKAITGGNAVGWVIAGEYLEYSVYVQNAGTYDVYLRSAAVEAGRTVTISQCNKTLLQDVKIPVVADWGQFKTWKVGSVALTLDLDWIHIGPYAGTIDPPDPVSTSSSSSSSSTTTSSSGGRTLPKFFVGNITTRGAVRSDFGKYWNQITPENEGKWGSAEATRDQYNWAPIDRIYQYARMAGIPVKAHTFVWGAQKPGWVDALNATETAAEIEEWIRDYCTRYPDTQMIDVVNEAVQGHQPAGYAQKAFGNNWIQKTFELARKYCPNSILILNDYNTFQYQHNEFIALAKPLAQGGYLDAVGMQSHDVTNYPAATLKTQLDNIYNQLKVPIYISEYDIGLTNDQQQLQNVQAHFPVFYAHPNVRGITVWGYVEGSTWITGSGLLTASGTERPSMTWLANYMKTATKK